MSILRIYAELNKYIDELNKQGVEILGDSFDLIGHYEHEYTEEKLSVSQVEEVMKNAFPNLKFVNLTTSESINDFFDANRTAKAIIDKFGINEDGSLKNEEKVKKSDIKDFTVYKHVEYDCVYSVKVGSKEEALKMIKENNLKHATKITESESNEYSVCELFDQ